MINKKVENKEKRIRKSTLGAFSMVILFVLITGLPVSALQSSETNEMSLIEQDLTDSSYSDFQKRMIFNSTQEAISEGISIDDAVSILEKSIENEIDAYNVKKFFDTLISAKEEGFSEEPLLNKMKEGLAKNVEERLIINALTQKSENMKIVRNLLEETQIENGDPEEMIDILADSLTNGAPLNALSQILSLSSEQGKSWQEVEELAEELGNLGLKASELGIDEDKIEVIFNQAIEGQSSLENICMNIQDLMMAAIAVEMSGSSSSRDGVLQPTGSSLPGASTSVPTSSSGIGISGTGSTIPSGETGSSPISSGDSSTSKPDSESGSSPLD